MKKREDITLTEWSSIPASPGIYMLRIGTRFYYGQSSDLRKRARQHRGFLRNGTHKNKRMQRAFNLVGELKYRVVALVPVEYLDKVEQKLIDRHIEDPRCLNVAKDANASARGRVVSSESRKKMRDSYFARSEESRKKLEVGRKGRKWSTKQRELFKEAQEKFVTEEYRRKISEATNKRYQNPEYAAKMLAAVPRGAAHGNARAVYLVMPNGERVEFGCKADAARFLGLSMSTLDPWLRGKNPWPGRGSRLPERLSHLRELTGGYL